MVPVLARNSKFASLLANRLARRMIYDGLRNQEAILLCGSCGYDNPREHRYCGMCGTPFPHRPLTVPEAQSTLTFNSAPIEVTPSQVPVAAVEPRELEPPPPGTLVEVEETPPAPLQSASFTPAPVSDLPQPATPEEEVSPPVPDLSQPLMTEEVVPPVPADEPVGASPRPPEAYVGEQPATADIAARWATSDEIVTADVHPPEVAPLAAEPAPLHEELRPSITAEATPPNEAPLAVPEPSEALTPPPIAAEAAPPDVHKEAPRPELSSMPEIRRYSPQPREAQATHFQSTTRNLTAVPRPPAPQSTEPPPESAGMPTFQSVAEAAGAPAISPFEPAAEKNVDEERELQEFVANFRYRPPEESVDELTMRSEVPVLDAEAPLTPSHPSFDDDVPPPPEAGAHPTGQEYYQRPGSSADRSRFLDIADSPKPASEIPAPARSSPSFLGLNNSVSGTVPPPDELGPPVRRRWLLWSSLAILGVVFRGHRILRGSRRDYPCLCRPRCIRPRAIRQTAPARRGTDDPCAGGSRRFSGCAKPLRKLHQKRRLRRPTNPPARLSPTHRPTRLPRSRLRSEATATPDRAQPQPSAGTPQSTRDDRQQCGSHNFRSSGRRHGDQTPGRCATEAGA